MDEFKKLVGDLQNAFGEFTRKNDERLSQIEKSGKSDPLLNEQVEKLNGEISKLQGQIGDLNTRANRVPLLGADGQPLVQLSEDEAKHQKAVGEYLRKGRNADDGTLRQMEQRAMQSNVDEDGGYLLASPTAGRIVTRVYETTPLRAYAYVQTISTAGYEFPIDINEADSGWVGETQQRDETNTPKVGLGKIPVHEIYAQPKQTQRFLDDAAVNVENWLAGKVSDRFARQENRAFAIGDGVVMPAGIFIKPSAETGDATRKWGTLQHIKTGVNGDFAANNGDVLIDVVYSVKAAFRPRAAWMMPRLVEAKIRKMKDLEGRYLWQPGLSMGQPSTIMGYPVIEAEDAPALGNGSNSAAFGDFYEGYTIVDRIGIRTLRDPFTLKGWVKFYTTKRVGGDVTNYEAIKLVKFSA